jgi:hypothetical protein
LNERHDEDGDDQIPILLSEVRVVLHARIRETSLLHPEDYKSRPRCEGFMDLTACRGGEVPFKRLCTTIESSSLLG